MPQNLRRLVRAFVPVVVLAGVLAGSGLTTAAQASSSQLQFMMDDDLLVYRTDAIRDQTMRQMKGMGADGVRVTVLWSVVAENANDGKATKAQKKRFKKLGASNPKAYPTKNWDRYDNLVRACKSLGLVCYLNVTGPGPSWTHPKPPKSNAKDAKWWKPDPRKFYEFVQAVSKRYSGGYVDENTHVKLPRVSFWSLWNEPNQGGWLRPQWENGKPASPALYRKLYLFGHRALVSTGHASDVILVGETAPANSARKDATSAMGPRTFIQELLCGPGSSGIGCTDFNAKNGTSLLATAYAHHPYTKKLGPTQRDPDPAVYTLANIGDLATQLDQLGAATGHIKPGIPLMSTEFGYETNPPDPYASTSPAQQAAYNQQADLITYLNPRILVNTQFLLRDVKPVKTATKGSKKYWSTYQSGLLTAGGTEKPAATAFKMPFLLTPIGKTETGLTQVSVFGQLRFFPNILSDQITQSVQLQYQPPGSTTWTPFGDPLVITNQVGYYTAVAEVPGPGLVRVVWTGPVQPFALASLPQQVQ